MSIHVQSHPELLPDMVKILSTALTAAQDKARELERRLELETSMAKAELETLRKLHERERQSGQELRAALDERCRHDRAAEESRRGLDEKTAVENAARFRIETLQAKEVRLDTELESLRLANEEMQSRFRDEDDKLRTLQNENAHLLEKHRLSGGRHEALRKRTDVLAIVLKKVLDTPEQTVIVERTESQEIEVQEPLVFHIERSPGHEYKKEREPLVLHIQNLPNPPPSCRPFFDEYHVRETHLQPVGRVETAWDAEFKPEFETNRVILHCPRRTMWYCRSRIHAAVFTPTHVYSRPEERWTDNSESLDAYSVNGQQVEFFANKGSFVYYHGTYQVHKVPPVEGSGWDIPADVSMYTMYRHTGLEVHEKEMLKECYANGYIRAKCFALQCVGFNYELYAALRERFPHIHVFGRAENLPTLVKRKAEVELGELVEPSNSSKRRKRKKKN
ncbi:hypothetical protein FB45DRAFT_898060 [Roridomyces roridus]|uniref:Uncharacterized protein n=1 Tax=Roridomyces roridus TaxID=1738132 RepID=A0AAD7CBM9_9AGAR|nr:hypothetical protein FB45DRAFT_898060 [Roridomyces roridus]